jgi:hypothetical protein
MSIGSPAATWNDVLMCMLLLSCDEGQHTQAWLSKELFVKSF